MSVRGFLVRSSADIFLLYIVLILTVSVSVIDVQIHNKLIKALFSLSDALKCTDLGTTKPQLKSCVRGQFFCRFHKYVLCFKKEHS